jgi:peptide/nickel transport system permease protein
MTNPKKKSEFLYFALRNNKLRVGLTIIIFFLVLTFVGPMLTDYEPNDYVNPKGAQPPSSEYWFGTTMFGQDVFTQFVHGLKATFLVGVVGGGLGTLIGVLVGFIGGYRGGIVDETLNMQTNIVLVIPTFAILLIIAAYLEVRGILEEMGRGKGRAESKAGRAQQKLCLSRKVSSRIQK